MSSTGASIWAGTYTSKLLVYAPTITNPTAAGIHNPAAVLNPLSHNRVAALVFRHVPPAIDQKVDNPAQKSFTFSQNLSHAHANLSPLYSIITQHDCSASSKDTPHAEIYPSSTIPEHLEPA